MPFEGTGKSHFKEKKGKMAQYSLIERESFKSGAKRTIKLAALDASVTIQYNKDHEKLRGVIREYGAFNQITIINNDVVDIEIALDYAEGKTYPIPSLATISIDEIMFQEFNVTNLNAVTPVTVGKITLIAAYESPLVRERRTKKMQMLGGR